MRNYPYVDMIRTKTHADGMLPVHIIVKNRKAEKRKVDIKHSRKAESGLFLVKVLIIIL